MPRPLAGLAFVFLLATAGTSAAPVGTSFTYQGELRFQGSPANAPFDFEFALYDVETGGVPLATSLVADQTVTQGLFSVEIDYTEVPFVASATYWIEVRVREGSSIGTYQPLLPRQKVTPAPYAINARSVQAGGVGASALADAAVTSVKIADGTITGTDIQDASIAGVDLASNSVSSTRIVDGTIVAADVNSASLQLRVTGSCAAGVVGVNADGSVACNQAAARLRPVTSFSTELHASANGASSIVIGTDGYPLVAIHHTASNDLVVVHCEDTTCTARTATAIDTAGDVGAYNSIGLDRSGFGIISYYDATNGDLKLALCNDLPCTSATIRTLDSVGDVGQYTSIGFTAFNRPAVAYHDETNGNLKVAICNDDNKCSISATMTADASGNDVGHNASLLLFNNTATIAYQDATARTLKVAVCGIGVCGSASLLTLDATVASGDALSMTRAASGFPAVFYTRNGDIYVVRCTNLSCTTFTAGTPLSTDDATYLAASTDALGFPVVVFVLAQAPSDSLGFLRCADQQCTSGYRTINSLTANPGLSAAVSVALGHHGFPVFTQRFASRTLIMACDNHACAAGSRPR
jgi:hypothetical protein